MLHSRRDFSRKMLTFYQEYVSRTTLVWFLASCTACGSIKAQNNIHKIPLPTNSIPQNRVVALGKLMPEGDVIKISAVNAKNSLVSQILVKEGDTVKANQVIAILQGQEQAEESLRDAQANAKIKQIKLLKIQQGEPKQQEITAQNTTITELKTHIQTQSIQKQVAIAQAQTTLGNAKLKYERYLDLYQQGAIKRSQLDNARDELDKAQTNLLQNKADLDNIKSTLPAQLVQEQANLQRLQQTRPVDIEIAKAELEQALIQLKQRKAELDNIKVRVPVAGQILKLNTSVGKQVNTSDGIAELGQTAQMYALAEVYETDIAKIRLGQQATLTSEYGGFQGEIHGEVNHIGLQVGKSHLNQDQNNANTDTNTRVVEVKIRLNPQDSRKVAALSGMQVRVKIIQN